MRIGRTILAVLVAASLATLPIAGAFAVPGDELMDEVIASEHGPCQHESMASETVVASTHDCCHHGSIPADHAMKDCYAACAAKCFSVFGLVFSGLVIPLPMAGMEARFVSHPFHSQSASLPFRPPRV